MTDSASVAELLFAPNASATVLRVPEDGMLLVSLGRDVRREQLPQVSQLIRRLADRLGCDPDQVLCLEPGASLEAISAADLARLGLRRITHG